MTTQPTNILQQVITWQPDGLAALQNTNALMNLGESKYRDFQNKPANLGATIAFDINPKSVAGAGLIASWQTSKQREQTLTCDQAFNVGRAITAQDAVFNLDANGYMESFGRADIMELGATCEINLGLNITSSVPVNQIVNGQTVPTGNYHTESGPYRFADFTSAGLTSFQQMQQMIVNFRNIGATDSVKVVLPDTVTPGIIGNGLGQFVPKRNDDIAMSWELGVYGSPPVNYYTSNLLPIHTSGTMGNQGTTLTVVSTNDPTGANITQITCSGAGTDSQAVFQGDLGYILDNVSGQINVRELTFYGKSQSAQQCQFRVTASAASSGGNVTFNIFPALVAVPGSDQNINTNIIAGMQLKFLPSHRSGVIMNKDCFYIAMPQLPDESPYMTANKIDEKTGVSMRLYYGSLLGQNQRGFVHDVVIGSCMVPERCARVCLPLTF